MTYWDGDHWISDRSPKPKERSATRRALAHSTQAILEASLLALLVVGLVAGTAFAAKGGGQERSGSVSLVMVQDTNGNGLPNWAEVVTFDVSTTADKPYVNVRCYQDGAFVYDAWAGFYGGAWFGQTFTLSSSYWTAGSADCTARLVTWSKNGRERTHSTMGFAVGG